MTARYDVIFAQSQSHVIDSRGNACRYRTSGGCGLAPGYYMVTWPNDSRDLLFDENASYRGPFQSAQAAQAAVSEALSEGAPLSPLFATGS